MPNWIPFAIMTALALATADIAVKFAANKISNSLGMLIYGSCVFLISSAWVLWQYFTGHEFHSERQGVIAAAVVGVSFCTVTIGLYITFAAGAPVSQASPMIRLAGLIIAATIGVLAFKEPFNLQFAVGMVLSVIGVLLILSR